MGLVKRTYVDGETVITADNLNDIQDEIIQNASDISTKGTYSKPSGGIPSTDMTTDVQTSLGKADTAYQKPSGGIPSTDLASAVQTSLGKADTAYQKPSGGIPSTDLASAVQTSLGKADTALQSSDIDNTLSVTGKAADAKKTGDEISDVKNTLNQLETAVGKLEVVVVSLTSPITFGSWYSNSNIEDDMVVLQSTLGTPYAQTADWTVTTGTGQFKVEGQSGTAATTLTLYFMKSR